MTLTYDIQKERQEAIDAGERALVSLKRAQAELDKARGWGIADILGGGVIISLIKRSKMENAQRYMDQARSDLQRFSKELRDVDTYLNINVSGLLGFADFFWDGFIADFLVQDKINDARRQVAAAIDGVQRALDQLYNFRG